MKKIFLSALMCIVAMSASAQIDFKSVDVKASLRHDFGLGVGTTIGLSEFFDIAPSLNAFFADGANTCFSIDADFHYNIDLGNEFHLFPLAGPALYHYGWDGGSVTKLGLNLGCGLDYDLDYNWTVFGEAKYQFLLNSNGFDDTFLSLGVKYRF